MDRLQHFLNTAAATPREQEGRHFRTWQRVSVQLQREIRSLVAERYFAEGLAAQDPALAAAAFRRAWRLFYFAQWPVPNSAG